MKIFVTCPVCGTHIAARIPKGGDGSAALPYWHKRFDPSYWTAQRRPPCEGRFVTVEEFRETRHPEPKG